MVMQALNKKAGKIMGVIFSIALCAWLVLEMGLDITTSGGAGANVVGEVNGEDVTLADYQSAYDELQRQAQQAYGPSLPPVLEAQLGEQAWNRAVEYKLISQELERRGITVSDDEIRYAAGIFPPPEMQGQAIFQTDGRFDPAKYRTYLQTAADPATLQYLEAYYRREIPRAKLVRQIRGGLYLTDAELWRAYRDGQEEATVEYIRLDPVRTATGEVTVTDAEIRAWYDANKGRDIMRRPSSARLEVASLPLAPTAQDRAYSLERARTVRNELAAGGDWTAVAARESSDPSSKDRGGDLGEFPKGQMVAAFDSAVFSLPIGEISQPVSTSFGWHVIQVQERTDSTAKARHVLIPIEKSPEAEARFDARADSLETMARSTGSLERAARLTNAQYRKDVVVSTQSPVIPGIGLARKALDWAAQESRAPEEDGNGISDQMESDEAVYVVKLVSYTPAGVLSLAEATPQIRARLTGEKRRERTVAEAQKMLAELRAGKTMQQVAASRGVTAETFGPFSRVAANPVFGQANEVVGAAFGTPVGQYSPVVRSTAGVFILRPVSRTQADPAAFEREKAQLREVQTMRMQQDEMQRWIGSLRKQAEIEDYRETVLRTAT
jgi:peptidyl-prolyl cis-trans isomerase D